MKTEIPIKRKNNTTLAYKNKLLDKNVATVFGIKTHVLPLAYGIVCLVIAQKIL